MTRRKLKFCLLGIATAALLSGGALFANYIKSDYECTTSLKVAAGLKLSSLTLGFVLTGMEHNDDKKRWQDTLQK